MNKELVTISTAVLAGAIARGATGMLLDTAENTTKMGVNLLGCAGFGFLATKVTGADTKAAALRGGAIGASIAHGLQFITNIALTEKAQQKLDTTSKLNTFLSKAAGLSSSVEGLAGYIDAHGNYHEDGLNGYIDAQGNFIEDGLNAGEPELIGYESYQEENEGLQASIDANGKLII
jgi:surface antigen